MTITTQYGPDAQCQRTACTADGPADHLGGAHLDPRDRARFDGNEVSLRAVTYKIRDELSALHYATRGNPELEELVDVALHAALAEIRFLRDQATHTRVDADRQIREASRRALDCEDHSKVIRGLEEQVDGLSRAQERTEKARLALLGGHQAYQDFLGAVDSLVASGKPLPDSGAVVEDIRRMQKKVSAAHTRAWSR